MPDQARVRVASGTGGLLSLVAFALGLVVRVGLIAWVPDNFSFDGFERWAGREHLLVHDWLPGAQSLIVVAQVLGAGLVGTRLLFAFVGALAGAFAVALVRELWGREAGWLSLPLVLFSPFLVWSTAFYQEGLYLLMMLGSLLLARRASARPSAMAWLLADLVAGGVALVRYEGWPFVLVYLTWRRRPAALVALWGASLWVGLRAGLGLRGFAPSPIDFADWAGLSDRFDWGRYGHSLYRLMLQLYDTGGGAMLALAGVGVWVGWRRRRPLVGVLALMALGHLAAVLGWVAGLETAVYRMQAAWGVILGILAMGPLAWAVRRWSGRLWRVVFVWVALIAGGRSVAQAVKNVRHSLYATRFERPLARTMQQCEGCYWLVVPRVGLGTRDRHDGCQIIQGTTELRHPRDFWCQGWSGTVPAKMTHTAVWRDDHYETGAL